MKIKMDLSFKIPLYNITLRRLVVVCILDVFVLTSNIGCVIYIWCALNETIRLKNKYFDFSIFYKSLYPRTFNKSRKISTNHTLLAFQGDISDQDKSKFGGKMRIILIFSISVFVFFSSFLSGFVIHNYTCITYPGQCEPGIPRETSNPTLGRLIIEGSTSFLNSKSKYQQFLIEIERSEVHGVDYQVLESILDTAIDELSSALDKYQQVIDLSKQLQPDQNILNHLLVFDYSLFQVQNNLNSCIFDRVTSFLQDGNLTGAYNETASNFSLLLEKLIFTRTSIQNGVFPKLFLIWENSQIYSESELFGQYVARVFYKISGEVN